MGSLKEVRQMLTDLARAPTDHELAILFREFDHDHTGVLTYEQVLLAFNHFLTLSPATTA
eukprot:NODE_8685_length_347_cov_118.483221_g6927_i0.p1 GENE.NODE_8685_length_347_cov_118.483221_g6927_i0~~NODE_8685_length_347_cov_118.483221_g6927_i0.p1  ORF type:complete len:67 (-),score=23.15 NODE_8685_length_347_cov_118.483221_g6927_i0:145-324(-)